MNAQARWTSIAGAGVVALMALSAVSCKKGEAVEPASPITVSEFKASAEGHAGDGKTTLNGLNVCWADGDDAKVFSDMNATGVRYVADGGFGTSETDFKPATGSTAIEGMHFYAVYPHDAAGSFNLTNKTMNVTIPAVQTYETGSFANGVNVMAAYTNSDKLAFAYKNVCGVLRLKLKGDATVRTVTVMPKSASNKLCGSGTITFANDGTPSLSNVNNGSAVCLTCPGGVRLTGEGVEFNLVVAPCSMAGGFDVIVVCDEGTFQITSNHDNQIDAGRILGMPAVHVTAVSHDDAGALRGVFSVGNNKKVRFSKGNLYYDENTMQWRFEDSQYDFRTYYGNTNTSTQGADACIGGVTCSTPTGQWGLFAWSTTAENNNWGMHTQSTGMEGYTDGIFNDWGNRPIVNGGNVPDSWSTLSGGGSVASEWNYLFNVRSMDYMKDDKPCRFAAVKVDGRCGLLLFPDSFSAWPAGAGDEPTTFNVIPRGWSTVDYNVGQFVVLEGAGCVFLPCAGFRNGFLVNYVVSVGGYWSSSISSSASWALNLNFKENEITCGYNGPDWTGRSVRLVQLVR